MRIFKRGIVLELQLAIIFFTACADALMWHIPGWKGWVVIVAQSIGGIAAALYVQFLYERAYKS